MKKYFIFSLSVAVFGLLVITGVSAATSKFVPATKPWGTCTTPVALTETYQDAKVPFTMKYPSNWQVDMSDDGFALRLVRNSATRNHALLIVGPHEVKPSVGEMLMRMVETAVLDGGHVTAVKPVQNRIGIYYFRKQAVDMSSCGEACAGRVPAQYYTLGVGIGDGTTLVHVIADVHDDAPKEVFCEVEAIERSLVFTH